MGADKNSTIDFDILKSALAFEQYDEISRIKSDIGKLNVLQWRFHIIVEYSL